MICSHNSTVLVGRSHRRTAIGPRHSVRADPPWRGGTACRLVASSSSGEASSSPRPSPPPPDRPCSRATRRPPTSSRSSSGATSCPPTTSGSIRGPRSGAQRKGIEVTVDHVGFADVVPRATAEVAAQSGHDIHMFIGLGSAFEEHVIDLTDVHEHAREEVRQAGRAGQAQHLQPVHQEAVRALRHVGARSRQLPQEDLDRHRHARAGR